MKLREKLKNKRFIMALAGLVGLTGLLVAPLSEAGYWYSWHWHTGPRHVYYHPNHHFYSRHVWVHRSCWNGRCHVERHVWVRR